MPFERIRLSSFRNLEDAEIETAAERVFLVGENGQGKTNFLEALYYLSFASSFRGTADGEAVRQGGTAFSLSAVAREELGGGLPGEEISVRWEDGTKEVRRSGKKVGDRKELLESNPAIVFCHEDFSFAAGEPERRRFFFDQTASLVSSSYIDSLREYKRILKQRNAAIKDRRISVLDFLDGQMARAGLALMETRDRLRRELDPLFSGLYGRVSLLPFELHLDYRPSWSLDSSEEDIVSRLGARRNDELAFGTSLSGPHRDRWSFRNGSRDFAATASTGQLRLVSISLRSVQAAYYAEVAGRKPVLLLDDVLLEIDPEKRKRFLAALPEASQAFFTFLPGERWEDYRSDSMIVYRMSDGRFQDQGCL